MNLVNVKIEYSAHNVAKHLMLQQNETNIINNQRNSRKICDMPGFDFYGCFYGGKIIRDVDH